MILKFTQDVDTLRPKIQLLGGAFSNVQKQVNYSFLRKWSTDLKSSANDISSITTKSKNFNAVLQNMNASTQREAMAIQQLNSEFLSGQIDEQGYKTRLDGINVSLRNAQLSTEQLTVKTKLLNGAMKLGTSVLNGIMTLGITAILSVVISSITKLIESHNELLESTKENLEKSKEEKKTLEDILSSYSEFADKTSYTAEEKEKLKSIQDELIKTFGVEAKDVDLVNGKYKEQIDLLNQLNTKKTEDVLNSAQARYNEVSKDYDAKIKNGIDYGRFNNTSSNNVNTFISEDFKNQLKDDYQNFIDEIKSIENVSYSENVRNGAWVSANISNRGSNATEIVETYSQIIDVLRKYGLVNDDVFTVVNNKYETAKKNLNEYETALEELAQASVNKFTSENPFEFTEDTTEDDFREWQSSLLDEYNSATDDVKNSMTSITQKMWDDYTISISPEIVISPKYVYDKQAVEDVTEKINNMFYSYDKDGNIEGSIIDKVEKFNKAMQDIGKNGFIDKNAYDELTKIYPQIADIFEQTEDGYTASLLNIQDYTKQFLNENSQLFDEAKDVLIRETASVNDEISKIDKQIWEARVNGGYDNRYIIEQLYDERDALISQRNVLDETKNGFDEMADSMQLAEDKNFSEYIDANTSAINNMTSSMKLLSNAYKEINEDGTVSIDTLLSLIDNGYATAICYDSQTGAITLNRKELEFLTKVKIETAIAELEQAKATAENTAEIEAQIIAYKELENHLGDVFKGEFNSGSNNSSSSSSSTKSTVESEQEKLAKTLKERLENEKKGIEAVNKEREKSIELIKAYNELNNAKNNKTIRSYSEERGWEYVTDQKAILESKQNLDKLIADYKNSMIDEQISAIDNMSLQALRNAINRPVEIPTNSDIMKDIQKNVIENIQNNTHTSNTNKNNYTINIGNINTDNAEQFLSELNDILKNGGLESYIGL